MLDELLLEPGEEPLELLVVVVGVLEGVLLLFDGPEFPEETLVHLEDEVLDEPLELSFEVRTLLGESLGLVLEGARALLLFLVEFLDGFELENPFLELHELLPVVESLILEFLLGISLFLLGRREFLFEVFDLLLELLALLPEALVLLPKTWGKSVLGVQNIVDDVVFKVFAVEVGG